MPDKQLAEELPTIPDGYSWEIRRADHETHMHLVAVDLVAKDGTRVDTATASPNRPAILATAQKILDRMSGNQLAQVAAVTQFAGVYRNGGMVTRTAAGRLRRFDFNPGPSGPSNLGPVTINGLRDAAATITIVGPRPMRY